MLWTCLGNRECSIRSYYDSLIYLSLTFTYLWNFDLEVSENYLKNMLLPLIFYLSFFSKYFKISQKTTFAVIEFPRWAIDVITIIIQRRVTHYWRLKRFLAGIYLLKVNNKSTRTKYDICSKLTTNTPEWLRWNRSSVFIVNLEHTSYLILAFLLLTLNM